MQGGFNSRGSRLVIETARMGASLYEVEVRILSTVYYIIHYIAIDFNVDCTEYYALSGVLIAALIIMMYIA